MDKSKENKGLTIVDHPGFNPGEIDRRRILQLMGASMAVAASAGMAGCDRKPPRNVISRHSGPEYQKPGVPLYYSTTWTDGLYPYGMVVKCVDGRPVKIEGNPDHPLNGEASNAQMQASLLSLYDPERLQHPQKNDQRITWNQADMEIVEALKNARSLAVIDHTGPSLRKERLNFFDDMTNLTFLHCEPIQQCIFDSTRNKAYTQKIHFDKTDLILSLDCDFLGQDGPAIPQSRDYAERKQIRNNPKVIKNYVIESGMTLTGSNADVRMKLKPSAISSLIDLLLDAAEGKTPDIEQYTQKHHINPEHLKQLLDDITPNKGKIAVCGGYHLPYAVHSHIYRLNEALGALDKTVSYLETTLKPALPQKALKDLAEGVDVLLILGCNPVYTWGDAFKNIIQNAKTSIGHALYINETLEHCQYQLPSHHNLESWNFIKTGLGYSYCQPAIQPLYDTRQEEASLFTWNSHLKGGTTKPSWSDFIKFAPQLLGIWNDEKDRQKGFLAAPDTQLSASLALASASITGGDFELVIHPHHAVYDGRFANNAWLQEMPDPVSKLVWDNAAAISPATAKKLKLKEGDIIEIATGEKKIEIPALIQPGAADNVITVTLGHGRTKAGPAGTGVGVNVAPLLPDDGSRVVYNVKVRKTGTHHRLVRVQNHFSMEGRKIALDCTLDEYRKDPHIIEHKKGHHHFATPHGTDIYPGFDYSKGYHWGMAIDTNLCTGCGACAIACQAENNIAVAGKEECQRGRIMHWLRLDRYEEGDPDNPTIYTQPMTCQQCDNAPCENVCPVNATIHGPEGLNQMAYNRCVGTRYCANNCPYKVRRFNFFDYHGRFQTDPVQELAYNPQVTVRMRGVMEKCTFCVQRINAAKFKAKNEGRDVRDGEIKTACQQLCPNGAIVFGNLSDPKSQVARLFKSNRAYFVLEQLNTQPSIAYLAKVRNIETKTAKTDNNH